MRVSGMLIEASPGERRALTDERREVKKPRHSRLLRVGTHNARVPPAHNDFSRRGCLYRRAETAPRLPRNSCAREADIRARRINAAFRDAR